MESDVEAESVMQQMVAYDEDIVRRFPESFQDRLRLAWTRYQYGAHLYGRARAAEGRALMKSGINAVSEVHEQHPSTTRFYSHLLGMLVFCPDPGLRQLERAMKL